MIKSVIQIFLYRVGSVTIIFSPNKFVYSLKSLNDLIKYIILSPCFVPYFENITYKFKTEDMIFDMYYNHA